jgi:predicted small metal-binding protein
MNIRSLINLVEQDTSSGIKVWHGAQRWEGSPEIRGHKEGNYEAGPGIYTTTRYMTARKYAKGGGSVLLMTLSPNLSFADDVKIPLADMLDYIKNTRMKAKKEIAADLIDHAKRTHNENIGANILINLVVNWRAGSGEAGRSLAHFLASHGVDAALERQSGEDWLVVINPKIIMSAKKMAASDVKSDMFDLPRIHP